MAQRRPARRRARSRGSWSSGSRPRPVRRRWSASASTCPRPGPSWAVDTATSLAEAGVVVDRTDLLVALLALAPPRVRRLAGRRRQPAGVRPARGVLLALHHRGPVRPGRAAGRGAVHRSRDRHRAGRRPGGGRAVRAESPSAPAMSCTCGRPVSAGERITPVTFPEHLLNDGEHVVVIDPHPPQGADPARADRHRGRGRRHRPELAGQRGDAAPGGDLGARRRPAVLVRGPARGRLGHHDLHLHQPALRQAHRLHRPRGPHHPAEPDQRRGLRDRRDRPGLRLRHARGLRRQRAGTGAAQRHPQGRAGPEAAWPTSCTASRPGASAGTMAPDGRRARARPSPGRSSSARSSARTSCSTRSRSPSRRA